MGLSVAPGCRHGVGGRMPRWDHILHRNACSPQTRLPSSAAIASPLSCDHRRAGDTKGIPNTPCPADVVCEVLVCPRAPVTDRDVPPVTEARCCGLSHRAAAELGSAAGGAQSSTPRWALPAPHTGPGVCRAPSQALAVTKWCKDISAPWPTVAGGELHPMEGLAAGCRRTPAPGWEE